MFNFSAPSIYDDIYEAFCVNETFIVNYVCCRYVSDKELCATVTLRQSIQCLLIISASRLVTAIFISILFHLN